jgi:3-methyladenine DNA glycosylase AlkD
MTIRSDVKRVTAHLVAHGSPERAAGNQWFFKEAIQSHGWRAADLRRYARDVHADLAGDPTRLFEVAETLFRSDVLEEKVLGVLVLQRSLKKFGAAEFRRFERWLPMVSSWADHDALTMVLIGPLMTADPQRARRVFAWAASRRRWHRRAAAVSLIDGVRHGLFTAEATDITGRLLADDDDMVRKGLGWLLREWGKVRPDETIPLLMAIRTRAPRLVLRTACERLPADARTRILARSTG